MMVYVGLRIHSAFELPGCSVENEDGGTVVGATGPFLVLKPVALLWPDLGRGSRSLLNVLGLPRCK